MEKLAAEMAAAEEAARRRAEEREREAAEQVEKAAQQLQEGGASEQSTANSSPGTKEDTPMETGIHVVCTYGKPRPHPTQLTQPRFTVRSVCRRRLRSRGAI